MALRQKSNKLYSDENQDITYCKRIKLKLLIDLKFVYKKCNPDAQIRNRLHKYDCFPLFLSYVLVLLQCENFCRLLIYKCIKSKITITAILIFESTLTSHNKYLYNSSAEILLVQMTRPEYK